MSKGVHLLTKLFPNLNNLTEFSNKPKVGVEAIAEKLPSPVNHCSLSSRRSQVQIQAGVHFSIENNNNKKIPKRPGPLTLKQVY